VVGGGPAGAVAAATASSLGLRTVVLEAATKPRWKPGEALAPECNPILDRVGLSAPLASLPDVARRSAGIRSAWGSGEIAYRDGFRESLGAGWIIDRARFEQLLGARAVEAGAEWFWGMRLRAIERCDDGWRLDTSGPAAHRFDARIVIDATGRPASVARRLGARRIQYQSQIANVVAWTAEPVEAAWVSVESDPDGWWYSASAPNGSQLLAQFRDSTAAQAGASKPRIDLHDALAATRLCAAWSRCRRGRRLRTRRPSMPAAPRSIMPPARDGWQSAMPRRHSIRFRRKACRTPSVRPRRPQPRRGAGSREAGMRSTPTPHG
jgi:2-polyprenyl-6-methoxyphenol hydroxylase-like FAD-dependent oxidoreductase